MAKFFKTDIQVTPILNENDKLLATINTLCLLTDFIKLLAEGTDIDLLSPEGKELKEIVNDFVKRISVYFHRYTGDRNIFKLFCKKLSDYMKKLKEPRKEIIHVATLNYDNLLYEEFNNLEIFGKKTLAGEKPNIFGTCLLADGFTRKHDPKSNLIFDINNLEPKQGHVYGYYLHLHGSPLLISEEGQKDIIKLERNKLNEFYSNNKKHFFPHVVLNSYSQKEFNIKASPILRDYMNCFKKAIDESEYITLLGYSGLDDHINEIIKGEIKNKILKIVEYKDPKESPGERLNFWRERFTNFKTENLIRLSCILDYQFE